MDNVVIFKDAHYFGYGVRFADIGKKLIAEALTLRAPLTKPAMSTNSMTAGTVLQI